MESLNFLKFWRPIKENQTLNENNTTTTIEVEATPSLVICSESEFDEGDDSFFELELPVSDFDEDDDNNNNNKESQLLQKTATSLSPIDVLSKRKILPIEPMAQLKKEKTAETEKTETPRKQSKFKFGDEASNLPFFTRASSLKKPKQKETVNESSSSSKRFSKDVVRKYLKKINPLHVKSSKKNEKMGFSGELKTEATSSSCPAKIEKGIIPAGFKHLSKSKSASASVTSPARRDDSLILHHDGIQSAILHCKNSFNSRDSYSLSRSTSTCSQETLRNLFSRDSSLSRYSSDSSSSEFMSARKSNEVGILS